MSAEDDTLPSHSPYCFGCGTENPFGLRLRARRIGDEIHGEVTFGAHHVGAPAFAHGGAVAAAIDDCLGFLLYVIGEPAVTAKLEVDYRRPVMIETPYRLRAFLTGRKDRKFFTQVEMHEAETGNLAAEGTGMFLTVNWEHFAKELPPDWRDKAKARGIELPW